MAQNVKYQGVISIKDSLHSCKSQPSNLILTVKSEMPGDICSEIFILNVFSPSVLGPITSETESGCTLKPFGILGFNINSGPLLIHTKVDIIPGKQIF